MIQEAYPDWERAPVGNESGYLPVWYNIVIRLDPVPTKTNGSIILPESVRAMQQSAETHCTLIAVGSMAFTGSDGEPIMDAPKPGDRIVIGKYSGAPPKAGDVENLYRFCSDKDVIAIQQR